MALNSSRGNGCVCSQTRGAAALCEQHSWKCSRVCVPQAASPTAQGPVLAGGLLQGAAFSCEGYEQCLSLALLFEAGITGSSFSSALCCQSQRIKPRVPRAGRECCEHSWPQGLCRSFSFLDAVPASSLFPLMCFHALSFCTLLRLTRVPFSCSLPCFELFNPDGF